MAYFKHETALVESPCVGDGTRIWAFAHVLQGAKIGRDCNICDHTFIENDVIVGDRVTVKCGVQLWDGLRVEDDVFIGPNATFTNDPFPRSRQRPERFIETVIRRGASIGANATILPGIVIEEQVMIGAGAVVTHNVPRNAVIVGNPGRIVSYDTSAKTRAYIAPHTRLVRTWEEAQDRFGALSDLRDIAFVEDRTACVRPALSFRPQQAAA
jgi:UDP-2-acetamido-3-amino-2,3-dideoxy-glucuronate N-acetyltransferase